MLPKAQAWVAAAIVKMGTSGADDLVKAYFGKNDAATRLRVKTVIGSIRDVIADPYFRSNLADCNQYQALAWVTPGQKTGAGQFVINICEKAVNYGCDVCIVGTIVHEASHHPIARTTDVCYPLDEVKALAKKNPADALTNAESFQYFIRDINGQL